MLIIELQVTKYGSENLEEKQSSIFFPAYREHITLNKE
jgi:hypothetical protein